MKAKNILFSILAMIILSATFSQAQTEKGRKIKVVIPILDEMAGSQFIKTLQDVAKVVGKETGMQADLKTIPYPRGVLTYKIMEKEFKENGADYSVLFAEDYAHLVKPNDKNPLVRPLAILTMDKKKTSEVCYFVKKDSPYKKLADLKGKTIGASTAGYMRYGLHMKEKYDGSIFDYFSKVVFLSDTDLAQVVLPLVNGEIDAFTTSMSGFKMAAKPPEAKDVRPIDCLEYTGNLMIVARYDIPVEEAGYVRKLFLQAHKSQAFSQFQFLFRALNGNFEPVSEDDLKVTREISALSEKYKWFDDDKKLAAMKKK